ncbi:MAG: cobalamin biosynthesis protein CbiX [Opitutae bacterium]|nr:cobalamin biosynthesis protein CbiX [Opitutae bacterium]|tara:strand:- start:6483 stop:7328 length:846 start_codon:yes stop_codon:yes gene_type:complete
MQRNLVKREEESPIIFLCDNGSLSPLAIRALRLTAAALGQNAARVVLPVGLLHSDRVSGGDPGTVLLTELGKCLERGERDFIVLPFFLGPSLGITQWLSDQLEELRLKWPDMRVRVAPCLHQAEDTRLARALSERINEVIERECLEQPLIALVDHGTPVPEVHAVRENVGQQLRDLMASEVIQVKTCSMERRPKPEYDFNEPLLENLLQDQEACPSHQVVVAQLFLSPGRHAGPDGDVANICRHAEQVRPGLQTFLTDPLGDHPLVLEILEERLRQCLAAG